MARKIDEIKQEILERIKTQTALQGLTSTSSTAIYDTLAYCVAVSIWAFENLLDAHEIEITQKIDAQKVGGLLWYKNQALQFLYGFAFTDAGVFDTTGATPEQLATSQVVKYAAVSQDATTGQVVVKIATEASGVLQPITAVQLSAFMAYMQLVKFAGVRLVFINSLADRLFLELQIYRNPLLIDANGISIKTGDKPVEIAISSYLKNLPFNGQLVLAHLIDALQKIEGVEIPHLVSAKSSYVVAGAYTELEVIAVKTVPQSGYYEMVDFNNISYVV